MKNSLAPHRVTPAYLNSPPKDTIDYPGSSDRAPPAPNISPTNTTRIKPSSFFDLVVIGAGPAGLALVARILESRPAALYTDQEHLYLHWLQRNQNPSLLKTRKTGLGNDRVVVESPVVGRQTAGCCCSGQMRILVIDKLGEGWMTNWNRHFAAFGIKHLRSPLFFHPAPADLDALIAFAEREGRSTSGPPSLLYANSSWPKGCSTRCERVLPELIEIPGCVGAEISKHKRASRRSKKERKYARLIQDIGPAVNERDRRDYFTPGTALFQDFVQCEVVERYGLDGAWETAQTMLNKKAPSEETRPAAMLKGEVTSINWSPLHVDGSGHIAGFHLETSEGTRIGAKAVVCAVGMGGCPSIPPQFVELGGEATHGPGWAHSSCFANPSYTFPPSYCNRNTVVVIGGGLTSAQICDLALSKGFSKAVLIIRSHLKVKPFDVSLDWMGRYSNLKKMEFWQEEDPLHRLDMLRSARGGGSITPTYAKVLRMHQDRGALEIRTMSCLEAAHWDDSCQKWSLKVQVFDEAIRQDPITHTLRRFDIEADFVVAATGTKPSFLSLPFVRGLADNPQVPPCPTVGGLPILTSHLQWPGLPLFCVGGYSALQVGPGAFNLGGMREAADRVVGRLEELAIGRGLGDVSFEKVGVSRGEKAWSDYTYFDFNLLSVEG